jgi:flagellar protein FlaG
MDVNAIQQMMQPQVATAPVAPVQQPQQYREVIQSVKALNAAEMFGQQNELMFHIDRQSRRMVIRVVNRETQEVVSQVPPEYILRLAEDLKAPAV